MRWIILAVVAATPAAAAEKFDLECRGGRTPVHYRVDLTAGEYCAGDCSSVLKMAGATTGVLTLEQHLPAFRGDRESRTEINRTTGAWHTYSYDPRLDTSPFVRDGQCELREFSGLPSRKF